MISAKDLGRFLGWSFLLSAYLWASYSFAQSAITGKNTEGGGDVYNFFFQKSGGGNLSVNTAGDKKEKKAVETATEAEPDTEVAENMQSKPEAKSVSQSSQEKVEHRPWHIRIAPAFGELYTWGDISGSVELQYDISENIGLEVGYITPLERYGRSHFSFGVVVNPFKLSTFQKDDLELLGRLGIMSEVDKYSEHSSFIGLGSNLYFSNTTYGFIDTRFALKYIDIINKSGGFGIKAGIGMRF